MANFKGILLAMKLSKILKNLRRPVQEIDQKTKINREKSS